MRLWPFGKKRKGGKKGLTLNVESLAHLMDNGRLDEAYEQVKGVLGNGSAEDHFVLFNIALMVGGFDIAMQALDQIAREEPDYGQELATCKQLLEAELWRQGWHAHAEKAPSTMEEAPNFLRLQCKAWHEWRQGEEKKALVTLETALDKRPAIVGALRTHEREHIRFEDLADADTFLEPALEVLSPSRYFLVPWSDLVSLEMEESQNVFESVLMSGSIQTRSGTSGSVWLPTLYAGSHEDEDDGVRTGGKTKWTWIEEGFAIGAGQRVLRVLPSDAAESDEEGISVAWRHIRSIRIEDVVY